MHVLTFSIEYYISLISIVPVSVMYMCCRSVNACQLQGVFTGHASFIILCKSKHVPCSCYEKKMLHWNWNWLIPRASCLKSGSSYQTFPYWWIDPKSKMHDKAVEHNIHVYLNLQTANVLTPILRRCQTHRKINL